MKPARISCRVLLVTQVLGQATVLEHQAFVFLGEVTCQAVTTLPNTLCVFAAGLVAPSACFAELGASTYVATRLKSDLVFGGLVVREETKWDVARLSGYFAGALSPTKALWFAEDVLQGDDVVAVVKRLKRGTLRVPRSFHFPPRVKAHSRKKKTKKADPYSLSPKELYRFLEAQGATKKEVQEIRSFARHYFHRVQGARCHVLVVPNLEALKHIDTPEHVGFVVVTAPIHTNESLILSALYPSDFWIGYWFCEPVSCLDAAVEYTTTATFARGLNARIVATRLDDCALEVRGHLECSIQAGRCDLSADTPFKVGCVTGTIHVSDASPC